MSLVRLGLLVSNDPADPAMDSFELEGEIVDSRCLRVGVRSVSNGTVGTSDFRKVLVSRYVSLVILPCPVSQVLNISLNHIFILQIILPNNLHFTINYNL